MSELINLIHRLRLIEYNDPPDGKVVPFPPERIVRTPAEIASGEEPQVLKPTPRGPGTASAEVDQPGTGIKPDSGGQTGITRPTASSQGSQSKFWGRLASGVTPELTDPESITTTINQPPKPYQSQIYTHGNYVYQQRTYPDGTSQTFRAKPGTTNWKPYNPSLIGKALKPLIPKSKTGAVMKLGALPYAIGAAGEHQGLWDMPGYDADTMSTIGRTAGDLGKGTITGGMALFHSQNIKNLEDKVKQGTATPQEKRQYEKSKEYIDRIRKILPPPPSTPPQSQPPLSSQTPPPTVSPTPQPPQPERSGSRLRGKSVDESVTQSSRNYINEFERYIKSV